MNKVKRWYVTAAVAGAAVGSTIGSAVLHAASIWHA